MASLANIMRCFPLFIVLIMSGVDQHAYAVSAAKNSTNVMKKIRHTVPPLSSALVTAKPDVALVSVFADPRPNPDEIIGKDRDGNYYRIIPAINSLLLDQLKNYTPPPTDIGDLTAYQHQRIVADLSPGTAPAYSNNGDILAAWLTKPVAARDVQYRSEATELANYPQRIKVLMRDGRVLETDVGDNNIVEERRPLIIDLNNDGFNEVITTIRHLNGVADVIMFFPVGDTLKPVLTFPGEASKFWKKAIASYDFDNDGLNEFAIITAPELTGYLQLYELRDGKIAQQDSAYGYVVPDAGPPALVYDFNDDGILDMLLARNDLQSMTVLTYARGFLERLVEEEFKSGIRGGIAVAYDNGYPSRIGLLLKNGDIALLRIKKAE